MELFNTCSELASGTSLRTLAYYSHLLPTIIGLLLAGVVLKFSKNRDKALLFFGFIFTLSLWLIADLVAWTSNNYFLVASFWSPLDFTNILFFFFMLLFIVLDFSDNRRLFKSVAIIGALACIPPFLITMSGLAVYQFHEPVCEMIGNNFLALYKLVFEIVVVAIILVLGAFAFRRREKKEERRRITLVTLSTVAFLAIFAGAEFLATSTEIYEIHLYALFVLPIFVLILAVSIFEFQTFRLGLQNINAVQILFLLFIIVTIANLFVIDDLNEFIMAATGSIITLGFGLMVWRGANHEKRQREQIEHLAKSLKKANIRLKELDKEKSEFVSIASHQLRSPLTTISGYASLLREGNFGKLPVKALDSVDRIYTSARNMSQTIEEYLNVSRIESGNMQYDFSDFNLRDVVEGVSDDLRPEVIRAGLMLFFRTDLSSHAIVHADKGKVIQAIHNLVNNALKYTKKGTIKILVRDDIQEKRIYVEISDTGIGMNEDTIVVLFNKFERANDAHKVNIHGTGLGLYMALKLIEAMDGTITAYSEGEGKGSKFVLELPLVM